MRKLMVVAVLALFVSSTGALAKERNVQLVQRKPASLTAGQAWIARISVKVDDRLIASPGKTPVVRITSASGRSIRIESTPTPRNGIYRARVVFPKPGTWRIVVVDRVTGRGYPFGLIKISTA